MKSIAPLSAAFAVVFASLSGPAFAQSLSPSQTAALRAACEADVRSICSGVQPGGGRLIQCLKANPDKVSPPCKDALAKAQASAAQ